MTFILFTKHSNFFDKDNDGLKYKTFALYLKNIHDHYEFGYLHNETRYCNIMDKIMA